MKNLVFTIASLCATLCYADNTVTKACDPITACDPVVAACEPAQQYCEAIPACEPIVTYGQGYVASSISCETRYIPQMGYVAGKGFGRERHVERNVTVKGRRQVDMSIKRANAIRTKTKAICR